MREGIAIANDDAGIVIAVEIGVVDLLATISSIVVDSYCIRRLTAIGERPFEFDYPPPNSIDPRRRSGEDLQVLGYLLLKVAAWKFRMTIKPFARRVVFFAPCSRKKRPPAMSISARETNA